MVGAGATGAVLVDVDPLALESSMRVTKHYRVPAGIKQVQDFEYAGKFKY